ncbi:hypothetical protein NMY22_g7560 [Coprinellus aureogranulatus]|nr:hypothetical protein NMY22_g7560 [Coprinellus aureogranulatus]
MPQGARHGSAKLLSASAACYSILGLATAWEVDGARRALSVEQASAKVPSQGFRMRVGSPNARRMPYIAGTASVNQTTFRCWDGTGIGPGTPGVGALDSVEFPTHPCKGGIRSQVYFPQCWDGKNLDSADHESHVAHPTIGNFSWQVSWMFGTDCPASHPVRIPLLFMETVWDTKPFNDPSLWPEDGSQPLVWSMGDPTGYGHHADYVFGWEREAFARAMESKNCLSSWPYNCDQLTTQTDEEINKCTQRVRVQEVTEGQYLEKLPGCNPIQAGPEPATMVPNCDAVSTTIGTPAPTESCGSTHEVKCRHIRLVITASAIASAVAQFETLRFPCSQLVTERLDPLVTPGQVSPHLHQIVGGNAFNITMDPAKGDIGQMATCTSCRFKEDKSNYWTAVLYFKHRNGSFIRVPQIANDFVGAPNGGMTIYYIAPRAPSKQLNMTIFPPGFRMRVGSPNARRNPYTPGTAAVNQTTFRCWDGTGIGPGTPGVGALDSVSFPARQCKGGIRSQVYFPQCWDGKNLDSDDHESHVAHPTVGNFNWQTSWMFGTDCPASHPIKMPLIFMETVWDTKPFNNAALWPTDGSQPLVWSMGDPTGYGHHADYVFGWEGDSLKRAMNSKKCLQSLPDNCDQLTIQSDAVINQCTKRTVVPEVTEGQYLSRLPGCNPLQAGPEPATMVPNCDAVSTTIGTPQPTQA